MAVGSVIIVVIVQFPVVRDAGPCGEQRPHFQRLRGGQLGTPVADAERPPSHGVPHGRGERPAFALHTDFPWNPRTDPTTRHLHTQR